MRECPRRDNANVSLAAVVFVVVRFARRLTDLDLPLLLGGDEEDETRAVALIFRYALA